VRDWDAFVRGADWFDVLESEFEKAYWVKLRDYVDRERARAPSGSIHRHARSMPR